jgi:protein-tyrosine phosphatase
VQSSLTEYRVQDRIFYTSVAPCTVRHKKANMSTIEQRFQGFAADLHEKGITYAVVLLTEEDMAFYYRGTLLSMYKSNGFEVVHYPIKDFSIPSSVESFVKLQTQLVHLTETNPILIHCRGGVGRTGLVAAGLIVALGNSALKAIEIVRAKTPGSIETEPQEQFLRDYALHIAKKE